MDIEKQVGQWAVIELMGHAHTGGIVYPPGAEWPGLIRVDVPDGEGYRTEMYGPSAVYAIRFVNEQTARAYLTVRPAVQPFHDELYTPAEVNELKRQLHDARDRISGLQRGVADLEIESRDSFDDDDEEDWF